MPTTASQEQRITYRTCPLCEATCGLEITVSGDQVLRIRGDRDDVLSRGFICPKGSALTDLHTDPDRLRSPMVKTKDWYKLPLDERQAMMNEHIAVGHKYHNIKINTTYSYGLDDQEFVVAFEGDSPGEFLALVRELRTSRSTSYTERATPMFTCRRVAPAALAQSIGLRGEITQARERAATAGQPHKPGGRLSWRTSVPPRIRQEPPW